MGVADPLTRMNLVVLAYEKIIGISGMGLIGS